MDRERPANDSNSEVSAKTRRVVLLGGAAGLAGLVADSVISADPAGATQGNPVNLGEDNTGATARTGVFYTGNKVLGVLADGVNNYGVQGQDNSTGGGAGVIGQSTNGTGVYGVGGTYGVLATDMGGASTGIAASLLNPSNPSPAIHAETLGYGNAVEATINNALSTAIAVYGKTNGSGPAIHGETTGTFNAVDGFQQSLVSNAAGVYGQTSGTGGGVVGWATNFNLDAPGVYGAANGGGPGVEGSDLALGETSASGTGPGVVGNLVNTFNASPAVKATTAGTGNALSADVTNAANTAAAVLGTTKGKGPGVKGASTTAGGTGVVGQGTNGATAVEGLSDTGTGVLAKSTSGDALKVVGKVAFSSSGLATVAANKTSVTVTLAGVTTSSMVIATLQTAAGVIAVANAVAGLGAFTVNLTAAPTGAVKVAWFVIG